MSTNKKRVANSLITPGKKPGVSRPKWGASNDNEYVEQTPDRVSIILSDEFSRRAAGGHLIDLAGRYDQTRDDVNNALIQALAWVGLQVANLMPFELSGDVNTGTPGITVDIDPANAGHYIIHVTVPPAGTGPQGPEGPQGDPGSGSNLVFQSGAQQDLDPGDAPTLAVDRVGDTITYTRHDPPSVSLADLHFQSGAQQDLNPGDAPTLAVNRYHNTITYTRHDPPPVAGSDLHFQSGAQQDLNPGDPPTLAVDRVGDTITYTRHDPPAPIIPSLADLHFQSGAQQDLNPGDAPTLSVQREGDTINYTRHDPPTLSRADLFCPDATLPAPGTTKDYYQYVAARGSFVALVLPDQSVFSIVGSVGYWQVLDSASNPNYYFGNVNGTNPLTDTVNATSNNGEPYGKLRGFAIYEPASGALDEEFDPATPYTMHARGFVFLKASTDNENLQLLSAGEICLHYQITAPGSGFDWTISLPLLLADYSSQLHVTTILGFNAVPSWTADKGYGGHGVNRVNFAPVLLGDATTFVTQTSVDGYTVDPQGQAVMRIQIGSAFQNSAPGSQTLQSAESFGPYATAQPGPAGYVDLNSSDYPANNYETYLTRFVIRGVGTQPTFV